MRGTVEDQQNTTVALDVGTLKEVLFKWADIVTSQSNDLWTLSLAFFGICILVVVHLHANQQILRPRSLMWMLYISALSSAVSLGAAYKLKGSVVTALKGTVSTKAITIPDTAAFDGLVQFGAFFLGLVLFLLALGWKSEIVAKAVLDTIKGK
ncbi:hypothetical protein CN206_13920 [Sinorhizobium meliloti]|nr:hypothetical protein CN206_13920 [Sinorhizobium meliloti]